MSKVRTVLKFLEPVVFKTDLTFWIWPSRSWDIAKKQTVKFFVDTVYIQKVHSTLKEYRKLFLKEWSYWCPRGGNKKTVLASLLWKPWSDRSKKVLFVLPWMFKLHLNSSVSDVNDGAGYTKTRQDIIPGTLNWPPASFPWSGLHLMQVCKYSIKI